MSPTLSAQRLAGRRILLGVTGGIAAYKAADLVRRLAEQGAQVQVVMTRGAQQFVTPLTFQAVSGREVRSEIFDAKHEAAMGHIELARWADLILVAPASTNFIAKLAQGIADDLLSTLCSATDKPIAIAPAMNRIMWGSQANQDNIAILQKRGVTLFGPGSGSQACGEIGEGRMQEPTEIRDGVIGLLSNGPLAGKHAVVTAGPTREAIDPVRFITNRSSGKMGYAVAQALAQLGAGVTLVSGPTQLDSPPGVQRVDVETAQEMLEATLKACEGADIFVGAAAVADYRPAQVAQEKIKKNDTSMSIAMTRTEDVLATVRQKNPRMFVVGFAAETEKLEEHARGKLERKKLDMIAANYVGRGRAFDKDDNELQVFWNGGAQALAPAAKTDLARDLVQVIVQRYLARK